MFRRNLIQISTRNTLSLTQATVVKRITPISMRLLSYQSTQFRNSKSTNPSLKINTFPSCRFYSEKITTSTHGAEIPEEVLNLPLNTYHDEADKFLDTIFEQLELLSEDYPELIPEVELNHGVMNLTLAKNGSYVINKQPPNKQIWFASPISGPNRFDFYQNEWISLRDNTKLLDVINKELRLALPNHDINITE